MINLSINILIFYIHIDKLVRNNLFDESNYDLNSKKNFLSDRTNTNNNIHGSQNSLIHILDSQRNSVASFDTFVANKSSYHKQSSFNNNKIEDLHSTSRQASVKSIKNIPINGDSNEIPEVDNLPDDIKHKYKILLRSLPFNNENKLESSITNPSEISPYDLMFACCKKCNPKNKPKYEIIKKCGNILEKALNIEYIIKKNLELDFLKEHLLTQTEHNLFKYHFKNLNISNLDKTISYLKLLRSEGVDTVTKEELVHEAGKKHSKLFEVFYDYHKT